MPQMETLPAVHGFCQQKRLAPIPSRKRKSISPLPSRQDGFPCLLKNSGARAFQDLLRIQASQPYPLIFRRRAAIYCWASTSSIPVPNSNILPSGSPTTILSKTSSFRRILLASMEIREPFSSKNCCRRPRFPTPRNNSPPAWRQDQRHTAKQHIKSSRKCTSPNQNKRD